MRLRATLEALNPRRFVADVACCPRGVWVRAPSGIEPCATGCVGSQEDHIAELDGTTTVRRDPDDRDYWRVGPKSCTVSIHSALRTTDGGHTTGDGCGMSTAYCDPPSRWIRSGGCGIEWSSTCATKHSKRSVWRITVPLVCPSSPTSCLAREKACTRFDPGPSYPPMATLQPVGIAPAATSSRWSCVETREGDPDGVANSRAVSVR